MRFRSVLIFLWPVLFLTIPVAQAQKRVFATVNPNAGALNSVADIFDPQTGKFTPAKGKLNVAREQHVSIRLGNGKILIAGGYDNHYLIAAELYDPSTGTFTATENEMGTARSNAAGVMLQGGSILIVGGYNGAYLQTTETYDPASDSFAFSGTMNQARTDAVVTVLNTGTALITGGFNGSFLSSAELYDPASRTFTVTTGAMSSSRRYQAATLLADGKVLVTGGCTEQESSTNICDKFLSSAEIYDPGTDKFTDTGTMTSARMNHTATLLPSGKVLIAGGTNGINPLDSAEIYDPATGTFTATGKLGVARSQHTATSISNGKVLIAGGTSGTYLASAEIFDPQTGSFTTASPMSAPRFQHAATALADGKVLLTGGQNKNLLLLDTNFQSESDNISPNLYFLPNSKTGLVSYAGSGVVLAFSAQTGAELSRITTGGTPTWIAQVAGGAVAVVSALDNKIFIIDTSTLTLRTTYTFNNSTFGYGSVPTISPDGATGYISSTGTGEVIKFDTATGRELGRLGSLSTPAQITITKDGKTLIVVDTTADELVFVDAASMKAKYKMSTLTSYSATNFNINNKPVLNSDESLGAMADSAGAAFIFDPSTGDIENYLVVGTTPGYTTLTPGGLFWLVLCQDSFALIPTWDPESAIVDSLSSGTPLGSANIVVSPDAKYAFFTSSTTDRLLQLDIGSRAVVGSFLVGDDPDVSPDQSAAVAYTPDYRTIGVLNFASNEIDLLSDITVLSQTKLESQQSQFTGVSIVNLSGLTANVTFTALTNAGSEYSSADTDSAVVNPVTIQLKPFAQKSVDVAQLFKLASSDTITGRLVISSDQPAIAGYTDVGKIHSDFLDSYLSEMQGVPLYTGYDQLHDFIIAEIPMETTMNAELSLVNPNYNSSSYDIAHYGTDGSVMETKTSNILSASSRETKKVSDLLSSMQTGRVLVVGGFDSSSVKNDGEFFDSSVQSFTATAGIMATPRQGLTLASLPSANVLVAGGRNSTGILKSAELFHPSDGGFSDTTGTMNVERYRHTATLLLNGKVLLAGGQNSQSINRTAELFDSSTGSFSYTTGIMVSPRDAHTATLLTSGKVLLVGGLDGTATSATAELYDPATSTFSQTGTMHDSRAFHTAVALLDGRVLITGGYNGGYLNSAEIYDPVTGTFTTIPSMTTQRSRHTATLLKDGTVLIAGGMNASGTLSTAEIFDPVLNTFVRTDGNMVSARNSHTASPIAYSSSSTSDTTDALKTRVVLIGGTDGSDTLSTAETYDSVTRAFTQTSGSMTVGRQGHAAIVIQTSDQGYLRVTSGIGMQFSQTYDNGGATGSLPGIDVAKYAGIKKIYSPQFAILPQYVTRLNLINANQDYPATVTVTLRAPNGTVLVDPATWILPKNGQIKGDLVDLFKNDSRLQNQTGYIEVSSSVDKVVGTISFTDSENSFLSAFELSGTPMRNFLFPLISEDGDYGTGIALLNSGDVPANVRVELWGPNGTLDNVATITMAPHTQDVRAVAGFFPTMQWHRYGNVRIQSDQPLHSLGILFSRQLYFLSSIPPVANPGQ